MKYRWLIFSSVFVVIVFAIRYTNASSPPAPAGESLQSQLFQGALEQWNSVDMTHIIVALIATAFTLLVTVAWARVAMGSATERSEKRSGQRWLLRPSNLLFVVGIAGVFYLCLGKPQIGPVNGRGYVGILILAVMLRYSENKAIRGWSGR